MEALLSQLQRASRPVCEETTIQWPHLEPTERIFECLRGARRSGELMGGLEKIDRQLRHEKAGVEKLRARGQDNQAKYLTRLLLLTPDGTKRFYRSVQTLLDEHGPGTDALILNCSSEQLSAEFFGSKNGVKALLLAHKDWVARFFQALLEQFETNR